MSVLPVQLARVSNLLRTNAAQGAIARTQQKLLEVQNELTTGRRVNVPSDAPGDAAAVQGLQKALEQREAFKTNTARAASHLGEVDTSLGDLTDLLKEAQTIASANVGSDVTPEQRAGAAAVVQTLYTQALSLANKQHEGVYLYAGDRSTDAPFVDASGGVKFVGSERVLSNEYDENTNLPFMVDGAAVFGALSTRVRGAATAAPALTSATRLADLNGAAGVGVRGGSVVLSNGTSSATVDLSNADTVGDVIAAINAAGVGGIAASLNAAGTALQITAGAGDDVTITESGNGTTAADLGILTPTAGGAGVTVSGADVRPAITPLTPIVALRGGAGIDAASGLIITNGTLSKTISFAGATTVEDLLNAINYGGVNVRAEINADGTGINVLNPTQGTALTIGENGGTTAADLGVRSFGPATPLAEMNGGRGVRTADGADFRVTRSDGTGFDVDVTLATTVQDVIAAINTAGGGAGITASFATTGNGIRLTDTAGGASLPAVSPLNASNAAADLGLLAPAAGAAINGTDANPVSANGVFANLAKLRDSLKSSDAAGITAAAEGLQGDYDRVVRVRGETGARVQDLEARQGRLEDQDVATKALLSKLQETDFPEAIARFQTLQTSLQAAMQTTAKVLDLSLLDFLS